MSIEALLKRLQKDGYFNHRLAQKHPDFSPGYWILTCLEMDRRRVFQVFYGEDWEVPMQYAQDRHRAGRIEFLIDHILSDA